MGQIVNRRSLTWFVAVMAAVLTLLILWSAFARDAAEADVARFIAENGFVEGAPGGLDSQMSQIRTHSIYFYSIADPSKGQVRAAFSDLTALTRGWSARDENATGAVFVNSNEDSLIYSIELRRLPVVEARYLGTVRRKAGSALVLAVGHNKPPLSTVWRRIKQSF